MPLGLVNPRKWVKSGPGKAMEAILVMKFKVSVWVLLMPRVGGGEWSDGAVTGRRTRGRDEEPLFPGQFSTRAFSL